MDGLRRPAQALKSHHHGFPRMLLKGFREKGMEEREGEREYRVVVVEEMTWFVFAATNID